MLLKNVMKCSVLVAGVAATTAMAEDAGVTTGSDSLKIGGEFRGAYNHKDNGLTATEDDAAIASDTIDAEWAKIKFSGNINSKTSWALRLNVLGAATTDYAYVTTKYGPVTARFGLQAVHQGGYHWKTSGLHRKAMGAYGSSMARTKFEKAIDLSFAVAGKLHLQFLNDVVADGTNNRWNKRAHPTFVLAWHGQKFGPIQPLFHYGTQDNQKSSWMDLGFKTEMSGLAATLDYSTVTTGAKAADPDDAEKSVNNESVTTAITLDLSYKIKGTATPFFTYSTFDNEQYTADGADQTTVNASVDADGNAVYAMGDNGSTWALGADLDMLASKNFVPYFKVVNHTGDFQEMGEEANTAETKSEMNISVGFCATM